MATLWETITTNSTLPVQSGNNFYDHLTNQSGGGTSIKVGQVRLKVANAVKCNINENTVKAVLKGDVQTIVKTNSDSIIKTLLDDIL